MSCRPACARVAPAWVPAWALALALGACAAPAARNTAGLDRFDGDYVGGRTQDPACGTEHHAMVFHVTDGRIVVNSRHKRRMLAGTVGPDGQVEMTNPTGSRHVEGTIVGDRLALTEAVGPPVNTKHRKTLDQPSATSCLWRFDAVRGAAPTVPADDAQAE